MTNNLTCELHEGVIHTKPSIIFSCDWESRGNYSPHHVIGDKDYFESVSREIAGLSRDIVGGKMVWYCKVDFYADITYYNEFVPIAERILVDGGQLGVHIHHISKDAEQRKKVYRWAFERMKSVGLPVTAYSAGMGEVYNSDVAGLLEAGFKYQRGAFPYIKHELCDWTEADLWPGYMDDANYKRVKPSGKLFTYAVGGDERNGEGHYQLHINRRIPLQRLKELFDKHIDYLLRENKYPLIGCYFHPYNLTRENKANILDDDVVIKWELFADWLKDNGVMFLTDSEAEKIYSEKYGRE